MRVFVTLPSQAEALYATTTYHFTEQPDQTVITSGPTTTYTYDANKLYRKTNVTSVMGGNTLQSYAYVYDPVGNITSITEPGLVKTYTYDDLNRLTQAVHTPTPGSPTTYNYTYDAIGNILSANGNTYSYSGTGKTNPHAVTSIGASNYAYDDNGNMTSAPNQVLTWNWQNQPTSILVGGTTNVTSAYDESGMRFLYQTPTTTEVAVGDGYLLRNGTPEINIDLAGMPVGVISSGVLYSSVADHLGTPVKKVNTSGTIVESVSYGPYGAILSQTGTINTKEGYTGHDEDVDTGLVYAQARYYNPGIARFMSQDPAFVKLTHLKIQLIDPQSWNSYSYARNNPIILYDPSGKFWTWDDAKEFGKGVANAIGSNNIGGFGRQESDNRYYQYGQTAGDIISLVQGTFESAAGIVAVIGGAAGGIITSPGGGALVGAAVSAGGVVAASHGYGVGKTATYNLMNRNGSSYNNSDDWGNPDTLQKHFDDHGADFRAADPTDYAGKAQGFRLDAESNGYLKKVDDNGVTRYYDPSTNTFGSYNADGSTKTFYKPDPSVHGKPTNMDYWKSQRGKTIR